MSKTKAELEHDNAALQQQLTEMRSDYNGACKTIADMHEAAVGEVRGPIRGVVEDIADLRARAEQLERQSGDASGDATGDAYQRGRAAAAAEALDAVIRLTGRTGGTLTNAIRSIAE